MDLVGREAEAQWTLERRKRGHPTESHHVMAGADHWKEVDTHYIPGTEDCYRASDSFGQESARTGEFGRTALDATDG